MMPAPATNQAQLLELCSMLRAIAVSRKQSSALLRQMAETYEIRAVVDHMPRYGA
ncbi:hypothetical protein [Paramagnetospirillum marisnigri]|uniref:hypothetical protein n=1 Tax=Paramagnetospirillum marisnigri TaxID=1285242 RepID=UPI0012E77F9D|nr:hypothetical protein [Paramagnetospirillum marisnigri]